MSNYQPLKIRRLSTDENGGLEISWDDGLVCRIDSLTLRNSCPCAECQEKKGISSHATPLSNGSEKMPKKSSLQIITATKDESLTLEQIWAIGNYALGLRWQDKHDSGIYPYALLRALSTMNLEDSVHE